MPQPNEPSKRTVNPIVFGASVAIISATLIGAVVATETLSNAFTAIQTAIVAKLGWFYILSTTGIVVFALWLMQSRFGSIKLGPDDSKPDFSLPTWFAMLFSAGMGIGLLFFSVAEPMYHYASPPTGAGNTLESARSAMGVTFFHWGFIHGRFMPLSDSRLLTLVTGVVFPYPYARHSSLCSAIRSTAPQATS